MNTTLYVTIASFMAGVIYALGRYSQRIDEHDRRLAVLEAAVQHIDDNIQTLIRLAQQRRSS